MTTQILDRATLARIAPSVFADKPYGAMSDRYGFVPTIEVVDLLADRGFLPVMAKQSKSRTDGKEDFTKHMVRFRHENDLDAKGETTDLVMVNSHDGSCAYNFMAGIFRFICENGLVVGDYESFKVKHSGGKDFDQKIIDTTYEVMESAPKAIAQIAEFKQITLSRPQQMAFATAALALRTPEGEEPTIRPEQMLGARRIADRAAEDGSRDLWTTLNAVQENTLRGGLRTVSPTGRRSRTRAINGVDADVKTNRALWVLAAEMAKLVG